MCAVHTVQTTNYCELVFIPSQLQVYLPAATLDGNLVRVCSLQEYVILLRT